MLEKIIEASINNRFLVIIFMVFIALDPGSAPPSVAPGGDPIQLYRFEDDPILRDVRLLSHELGKRDEADVQC